MLYWIFQTLVNWLFYIFHSILIQFIINYSLPHVLYRSGCSICNFWEFSVFFFIHYWFLFYLDCAFQTNFVWFLFFWYYCVLWHRTWSRFMNVSHELEENIYLSPATTTYTKDVSEWFNWQCSLDLLYTSDCLWDSNGDIEMFNHSLSFSSARFYPWIYFFLLSSLVYIFKTSKFQHITSTSITVISPYSGMHYKSDTDLIFWVFL